MYAIVNVMYGVPLADDNMSSNHDRSLKLTEMIDDSPVDCGDEIGIHAFYHGGSDLTPAGWGVVLCEFDECVHHTESPQQFLAVPQETVDAVHEAWDSMDATDKKELEQFGQPRLFLLWSTS